MQQAVLTGQVNARQGGEKAGPQHAVHHPAGKAAVLGIIGIDVDGGDIAGNGFELVHHFGGDGDGEFLTQTGHHLGKGIVIHTSSS